MRQITKIEFTSQEEIDQYESTARKFLRDILDQDLSECLITDESNLSDFASCGLPAELAANKNTLSALYDAWDRWIVPRVCDEYAISPFKPSIRLVELFRIIEAQPCRTVH